MTTTPDPSENPYRVLVLAGRGRYEDPWHDHAATSHRLATVLDELELGGRTTDVVVRSVFPDALDDLDEVDLLVVNAGTSWPGFLEAGIGPDDDAWAPFHERLDRWARDGGGVLAVHQAANTFGDAPGWEEIVGGRWVPGTSYHPPFGRAEITLATGGHPIVAGAPGSVALEDERYCALRVAPSVEVLGWVPDDDDEPQPALWTTEEHGGRTVYCGLGHDVRAYDSREYVLLLLRAATWLLT
ncbi:ThuA domain-containing protein [Isoptericola halotolerans]|uniref:ThuA domain-containing protein n=1 Tax=Isoptericola halotolerans TaxID=300560 RepID=UPI00388EF1E1